MAQHSTAQQRAFLAALGFRVGTAAQLRAATSAFQASYNLGGALVPDGIYGAATTAAANVSAANGHRISAHFRLSEFTCGCGGASAGCQKMLATRQLLVALEKLRARNYPEGLRIVSGYRCDAYNRRVGGIANSHHRTGRAVDIPRKVKPAAISTPATGLTGIGYGSHGLVIHVDVGQPSRYVFRD